MSYLLNLTYGTEAWQNNAEFCQVRAFIAKAEAPFPGNRFHSAKQMLKELDGITTRHPIQGVHDQGINHACSESPKSDIYFGHYQQSWKNGKYFYGLISWIPYSGHDGIIHLVSRYILDYRPFNESEKNCRWYDSDIRRWLNTVFLETAFTPSERKLLLPTYVEEANALFSSEQMLRYNIHSVKKKEKHYPAPDYVILLDGTEGLRSMPELCGETAYAGVVRMQHKCNCYELTSATADGQPFYPSGPVIYDEANRQNYYRFSYPAGIRPVVVVQADFKEKFMQLLRTQL